VRSEGFYVKFHWTILVVSSEDCRIKKFKVTPLTIILVASICATLAILSGFAGYGFHILRPAPLWVVPAKQDNRGQAHAIVRLSSEVAKLDREVKVLRDYNRHLSRLSNISIDGVEGMSGMGGGGEDYHEQEATAALAEKMLNGEIGEHIKRLGIDISIEQEVAQELLAGIERQRVIASHTPCICPIQGWMTSTYGWRDSPFTGEREFHNGIDIASLENTPVLAPADGTVTAYYNSESYGNVMVINHGYGIKTRYCHLKKPEVKIGGKVIKGKKIAYVGNSGQSTGSHLHYEIIVNGSHVNPQRYMLK